VPARGPLITRRDLADVSYQRLRLAVFFPVQIAGYVL
jgi:hypothetical protein